MILLHCSVEERGVCMLVVGWWKGGWGCLKGTDLDCAGDNLCTCGIHIVDSAVALVVGEVYNVHLPQDQFQPTRLWCFSVSAVAVHQATEHVK